MQQNEDQTPYHGELNEAGQPSMRSILAERDAKKRLGPQAQLSVVDRHACRPETKNEIDHPNDTYRRRHFCRRHCCLVCGVGAKWAFVRTPISWTAVGADYAEGETAKFIVPTSYDWGQKSQFDDFAAVEFKVADRQSILVKRPDAASFGFTPSTVDTMELLSPTVAVVCRRRD